jgi:hypothetical protein
MLKSISHGISALNGPNISPRAGMGPLGLICHAIWILACIILYKMNTCIYELLHRKYCLFTSYSSIEVVHVYVYIQTPSKQRYIHGRHDDVFFIVTS